MKLQMMLGVFCEDLEGADRYKIVYIDNFAHSENRCILLI